MSLPEELIPKILKISYFNFSHIKDKVEIQIQFRLTPVLQGDKDRVLVQYN